MNIKTVAIIATAAVVVGGIIVAITKPWKKGEKNNNDTNAKEGAEQPAAPAPAPEAPAPEAGKTDEKENK